MLTKLDAAFQTGDAPDVLAFTSLAMPALVFFLAVQNRTVNGCRAPSRAET